MTAMTGITAALFSLLMAVPAFAGGDFDQGIDIEPILREARPTGFPLASGRAGGRQYVSIDLADIDASKGAFPLKTPVLKSEGAAIFQVAESDLEALSEYMHENFNRCGGFFSFRSLAEAQEGVKTKPVKAGGPYTIDQQSFITPIVANVKEAEVRSTVEKLSSFHNRMFNQQTGVDAAHWIKDRWQALAGGLPGASAQAVAHAGWSQPSVVLTIPGAELPDEIVVLGGHLDSINGRQRNSPAPGADDNASGIAVLTEAIRVLAGAGIRPKRTIQFMGYAAEEVGLKGSQDIARQYAQSGRKVVGVIQFDMSLYKGSPDQIYLLTDHVDASVTAFLGKLIDAYVGVKWGTTKCGYACSDHASWTKNGFPAGMAFEAAMNGSNPNIHTDRDTLASAGGTADHSVNFAKLAVAFAAELAKTMPAAAGSAGR